MEEQKFTIVPHPSDDPRFSIADLDGKVIDDAQGWGFKSKQAAIKAAWYRFGGGKQKIEKKKSDFKELMKVPENKRLYNRIDELLEWAWKEITRKETTVQDIFKEVEKEFSMEIPEAIRRQFSRKG